MLGGTALVGGPDLLDAYGPQAPPLSELDRQAHEAGEAVLAKCAFEDIFLDSKFLQQGGCAHTQHPPKRPWVLRAGGVASHLCGSAGAGPVGAESLVHLVTAVIAASGPIPRPQVVGLGVGVTGSLAYTAGGAPISGG